MLALSCVSDWKWCFLERNSERLYLNNVIKVISFIVFTTPSDEGQQWSKHVKADFYFLLLKWLYLMYFYYMFM